MSGHDEEDDKPTVVLDLETLRSQVNQNQIQDELDEISSELEFTAGTDPAQKIPDSASDSSQKSERPVKREQVVLFDFNSQYFTQNKDNFPQDYQYKIVYSLEELNQELRKEGSKAILFNYNAAPKAVNQLCAQIKQKFSSAKTVILAKNLSEDKARAHRNTKSGANAYLSAPFKPSEFGQAIKKALDS